MASVVAVLVATSVMFLSLATFAPSPRSKTLGFVGGRDDGGSWRKLFIELGGSGLAKRIPRDVLQRRVDLAGGANSLEFFLGLKLTSAMGGVVVLLLAGLLTPVSLVAAPVAGIAAFQMPDIALARRAKVKLAQMSDQVSDLADVLLVMTDAGLSPAVAFRRAAEALPEPLGPELTPVIQRLELGVPWRVAVAEGAERTGVPPLKRLVRALTRSQRLGTSLAIVLRTIANDLRGERRAQAETAARQAPVKMLFPLVFLILPAFLLLTVGPVVLSTIRSFQ